MKTQGQGPGGSSDPADRCSYPKPFAADFGDCPSFQAVSFLAADSTNRALGTWLTCRHLTTGRLADTSGHFYPRCGLGSAAERRRWLALVSPARLELVRAIQEEFDAHTRADRQRLFEAKAAAIASPQTGELRDALDLMLGAYLDRTAAFMRGREARLDEVGLPVEPLLRLIEDWSRAWVESRQIADPGARRADLEVFPPAVQAFLGPPAELPWRDRPVTQAPIFETETLRISRTFNPDGLRFDGDIDASNVGAVGEALATRTPRGGDLHIDLSGLVFCDLGGLRAIMRVAHQQAPGQRVVLQDLPAHLARAMRIVGWADLPNVTMVSTAAAAS